MDNRAAVTGLNRAYSPSPHLILPIRAVRDICAQSCIVLRVCQIGGDQFNQIADHLSHGRIAEAVCRAQLEFGLVLTLR